MARIVNYKGYNYNDLSIVPSLGVVNSRTEIPLEGYRIVVSGMSSIIGEEFLKEWAQLPKEIRPMIHIPRDKNSIKHLNLISNWKMQDWIWVGVGLNTPEIEDEALKLGYKNILIDIAFGGVPQLNLTINRIKIKFNSDVKICTGSVSTMEMAANLDRLGVNVFRVGIGTSSSICATSRVAGVYLGIATEIMNVYQYTEENNNLVVLADGGLKTPADYAKAFLLGADYTMGGFCFTKCKSAQMYIDGSYEYYGMSNPVKGLGKKANFDESFVVKQDKNQKLYSLFDLLMNIWNGIRSAVSYSGYSKLSEAIGKGEFIELKSSLSDINYWK